MSVYRCYNTWLKQYERLQYEWLVVCIRPCNVKESIAWLAGISWFFCLLWFMFNTVNESFRVVCVYIWCWRVRKQDCEQQKGGRRGRGWAWEELILAYIMEVLGFFNPTVRERERDRGCSGDTLSISLSRPCTAGDQSWWFIDAQLVSACACDAVDREGERWHSNNAAVV